MISDISMLVIVSTTSLGGCFGFILYHLRRSRCTEINCCCFRCRRDLMNDQEMQADKFEQIAAPRFKKAAKNERRYSMSDDDNMNDLEDDSSKISRV